MLNVVSALNMVVICYLRFLYKSQLHAKFLLICTRVHYSSEYESHYSGSANK